MSNGDSTANDLSDKKRKKMLRLVRNWKAQKKSVGNGSCWALPFKALIAASADMPCRRCDEPALYVWGSRVDKSSLAPGDIIQVEGAAKFINKSGTLELSFPHEHHSMIVMKVISSGSDGGVIRVAHQWIGSRVHYNTIRLSSKQGPGVVYYYRPQSTKK